MWRRCVAGVSLLAAIGFALAGCGSGATRAAAVPAASASVSAPAPSANGPTPIATPTPAPSATPFVSPADEAGAYAFVKAYFAELDRAYATGDVSRLKPYRLDTCSCIRSEKLIRSTYTAGGRITGVKFSLGGWAFGAHGPSFARTAVAVSVPAVSHEMPSKPAVVEPSISGYYAIDLRRQTDHWVVFSIRVERVT